MLTFHTITPDDHDFLWEMVYAAIHVPPGHAPPPREVIRQPEIAQYFKEWGRAGDYGVVAVLESRRVGAAWVRLLKTGYGYVDDHTPELSIALLPDARGQGIGTKLLGEVFAHLRGDYAAVSLSVDAGNPARRLYARLGFSPIERRGDSIVMVKKLMPE